MDKKEKLTLDGVELPDWPQDWDIHVARAFRAYLSNTDDCNDVSFESSTFSPSRVVAQEFEVNTDKLSITFKMNDKRWISVFSYDGDFIFASVEYVILLAPLNEDDKIQAEENALFSYGPGELVSVWAEPVCTLVEDDVLVLIEKVRKAIIDDYWRRRRGNDDDDDGDVEPKTPTGGAIKKAYAHEVL